MTVNLKRWALTTAIALAIVVGAVVGGVWIAVGDVVTGEAVPGIDNAEFWIVNLWGGRLAEAVVIGTVVLLVGAVFAGIIWLLSWTFRVILCWDEEEDLHRMGALEVIIAAAAITAGFSPLGWVWALAMFVITSVIGQLVLSEL